MWNHIQGSFVPATFDGLLSDCFGAERSNRDAKVNKFNDMKLSMRPYLFAGLYIPSSQLTLDGSINTSLK